jgi:thiol:disulfide interchange protein DsbD
MRKIIFFYCLRFGNVNSQMLDPVKWTTKIEKKSDNTYLLTFDGVIEKIGICTPSLLLTEAISFGSYIYQKNNFSLVGKQRKQNNNLTNDIF